MANEINRTRSSVISILETIQNQDIRTINSIEQDNSFDDTDIGIENPKSKSKLKILENGDIALKNSKSDGIFISKKYGTVLINGKNINFNSDYLNIKTRPDGFRINGYYFNPEAITNGEINIKKDDKTITVPLFVKLEKDNDFENLLKEFGVI